MKKFIYILVFVLIGIQYTKAQEVFDIYYTEEQGDSLITHSLDSLSLSFKKGYQEITKKLYLIVGVKHTGNQDIRGNDVIFVRLIFNGGDPFLFSVTVPPTVSAIKRDSVFYCSNREYPINIDEIKQGDYANELCADIPSITYSGVNTPVAETPYCAVMTMTFPPEELKVSYLGYIVNRQGSSMTTSALDEYYYNDTVLPGTNSVTLPVVINFENKHYDNIPEGTPIIYQVSFNDQFLCSDTSNVEDKNVIRNATGFITSDIVIPLSLFKSGPKANSLCVEITGAIFNQVFDTVTTVPLCARFTSNIVVDSIDNTNIDNLKETKMGITLNQNIPNPANNSTRINYSVPEAEKVIFHVHSISGQLLYSKTIEASRGNQSIELNTSMFAAGIYFYSIEYKDQRIVKRMSVQK
jgi:hypothetical protein